MSTRWNGRIFPPPRASSRRKLENRWLLAVGQSFGPSGAFRVRLLQGGNSANENLCATLWGGRLARLRPLRLAATVLGLYACIVNFIACACWSTAVISFSFIPLLCCFAGVSVGCVSPSSFRSTSAVELGPVDDQCK